MSLHEKMFNVMNDSDAVEKSMTVGKGVNAYKAVSEATILNMIKPLFKKYKLIIFPISGDIQEIVDVYNKTDYDGKTTESQRAITQLQIIYRIMDIETDEFQDVVGFGNGADSQDKGAGKAFTYSFKNALSKTFMLFSGEDTDNDHSDDIGKYTKTSSPKTITTTAKNAESDANKVETLNEGKLDADAMDILNTKAKLEHNEMPAVDKYNSQTIVDGFKQTLRNKGFKTEDGKVDWDKLQPIAQVMHIEGKINSATPQNKNRVWVWTETEMKAILEELPKYD